MNKHTGGMGGCTGKHLISGWARLFQTRSKRSVQSVPVTTMPSLVLPPVLFDLGLTGDFSC